MVVTCIIPQSAEKRNWFDVCLAALVVRRQALDPKNPKDVVEK